MDGRWGCLAPLLVGAALLTGGAPTASAAGAARPPVALEAIGSRPATASALPVASPIAPRLTLLGGEADGLFLRIGAHERALRVLVGADAGRPLDAVGGSGLEVSLHRVAPVPGTAEQAAAGGVLDALLPLAPGSWLPPSATGHLLWMDVSAGSAARASVWKLGVRLREEGASDPSPSAAALAIRIEVLPIVLPGADARLQAAVWAMPQVSQEATERTMELLRRYRFDALAGLVTPAEAVLPGLYPCLLSRARELGYLQVRLPTPRMLSWRRGLGETYGPGPGGPRAFAKEWCEYLGALQPLLDDPRLAPLLVVKVWDEPRPEQYPDVVRLHGIVRGCRPELRLELAEEPAPPLAGAADLWVGHVDHLEPRAVAAAQARGEPVWGYANRWLEIDAPAHAPRAVGWWIARLGLDGYHAWAVNRWSPDPWTTVSSPAADDAKGGVLVYPARGDGDPVVPSLRLTAFRRGIDDLRLLRLVERAARLHPLGPEAAALSGVREELDRWEPRAEVPPDPSSWTSRLRNAARHGSRSRGQP